MAQNSFNVIIIGGGATGAGIARDCACRGLSVLLLERGDVAIGATGRNHGLLHSGARYAVTDFESAHECISENRILKRVASHCVDDTRGLFLTLPEDDLGYQPTFVDACRKAGIDARVIDPQEALMMDRSVNPDIIGAVVVPDASVDPFRLTAANVIDARAHGAVIKTYCSVEGLICQNGRVIGVKVLDKAETCERQYYADVTVNAAGIWGQKIAEYAEIGIKMFPAKGALLIFGHRVNSVVLNRCRKPADADILVPGDTISLIGTTSTHVGFDEIDRMQVTYDEVETLLREGAKLAPSLAVTRILRAYAGVRPLVASDDDPSGRNVSRGIVLMDHAERDGIDGFITITGGKLMTYRLMAEMATDLVCSKLAVTERCTTAEVPLPGSRGDVNSARRSVKGVPVSLGSALVGRHGEQAVRILEGGRGAGAMVCECEAVSEREVEYAIKEQGVKRLEDLRRRTRVGMGTCQGELCACRAASLLRREGVTDGRLSKADLMSFLESRWKGVAPVVWGDTLRESEFTTWIYRSVCGLGNDKL